MKLFALLLTCTLSYAANAQMRISGKIFDARSREPLSGATIKIAGSGIVSSSNEDGEYSLPAQAGDFVLEVSFVGYKTSEVSVAVPQEKPLFIYLQPESGILEEVIVSTGYQQIPKERSTGSFVQIENKIFNEQVGPDILTRLEAIAGGLSVDRSTVPGAPQIMIRGLSTIRGPKGPLIVVDNFPYEGDINNINPNDVDNITILKDAAASSIWGTRAGNGVIVITTKTGRFNQSISADLSGSYTIGSPPDLSKSLQLSSSDYIDVERMLFDKGYYNNQIASLSRPVLSPVVEVLAQRTAGTISAAEADAAIDRLRSNDVRSDFNKYLYRSSANRQYALGVRGGSDRMAWNFSAGSDNNTSVSDAGYERVNLKFQDILKPLKGLQVSSGIYYTRSSTTSGKPGFNDIDPKPGAAVYPYSSFADEQGRPLPFPKNYRSSYIQTVGGGKLLNWEYYPLLDHLYDRSNTTLQDVTANLGINYQLLNGLFADVKYQYERQQTMGEMLHGEESFYARNLVNSYSQINAGTINYRVPKGGVMDLRNSLLDAHSLRGQLNFDRSWKEHTVTVLTGAEMRTAGYAGATNRLYGFNENILTNGKADLTTLYPHFISGTTSFIPDPAGLEESMNRYLSAYGNGAYTFRNRYTVSLSARKDASNLFGLNTNHKWNPLWSAGLAWDVSQEKFYHWDKLEYFKLRSSYGFSGNIDPGMSALTTMEYVTNSPYTLSPYARFNNYSNPELRWETSRMFNIGIDFRTRNAVISGSLEYYTKRGTNLFGNAVLDYTSGLSTITKNVASMRGSGADVLLNSLNFNGAFQWSSQLNLSYYKDKVEKYHLSSLQGSNFLGEYPRISGLEGRPVYSLFSYRWAGLDATTGDPMGYLNGQVSKNYSTLTGPQTQINDLIYHGPVLPTWFGSLGNTLSWKNLSITARITFKAGHYFRRSSIKYYTLYENGYGHTDYLDRWQKPGDENLTTVPSMIYPASSQRDHFYENSEILVEKADHVRFQYLNLNYTLNQSGWKSLPLKSLNIFLNINNLGIIWRANKAGIDPEYPFGTTPLIPGKMYAFGLRTNL